ncbi:putative acetyltransferase [Staphylococcus warneri]|nr:hypothetical protein [Staphylococcus warneri]VED25559.1 putative acetyltransferase [Staphylococcus warneri]
MKFIIRQEQKEDYLQTEEVVKKAFENESYSDQINILKMLQKLMPL